MSLRRIPTCTHRLKLATRNATAPLKENKVGHNISYFICGTARSGSSFFGGALRKTHVAGSPDEYFEQRHFSRWCEQWGVSTFEEQLQKALQEATTANGVCGITTHKDGFLEYFVRRLEELPQCRGRGLSAPEVVANVFPNLHYIWLTRRNKVRQAVSLWKATQTGHWVGKWQRKSASPPVYDYKKIDAQLQLLVKAEAGWQEYFTSAQVRPLTVVYEDFVVEYDETIRRVLRYLGLEEQSKGNWAKPLMNKQADAESERWVQRYHAEKQQELQQ
jgi:LPS sulfotransferase NodH